METFEFLGLTVYPFGLFISMAALLLLVLMGVMGYSRKLPQGTVRIFGILAVPLGIVFARVLYCLMNIPFFVGTYENPALMLRFFDGGFSLSGLFIGMLLSALLAAKINKASFSDLMDVFAVALGAFLMLVFLGEKHTELGVGKPLENPGWIAENLPFLFITHKMGKNIEYRMAVYLYQAIFSGILFLVMLSLFLDKKKAAGRRSGDLALIFFSVFGAGEILLESLRDDGHMLLIFLRVGQLCAVIMPLVCMIILSGRYKKEGCKGHAALLISWLAFIVCIAAGVLMEFALDGRLATGMSLLQRYAILAVICIAVAALPLFLLMNLKRKAAVAMDSSPA
ncbi:MAG: hypothetical protein E7331_04985 [Clostridiales bacterium]|nr:hypothetical protein [Clostridiales bacterium]